MHCWVKLNGIIGTHLTEIHQQGPEYEKLPGYIDDARARADFLEQHRTLLLSECAAQIEDVALTDPEEAARMRELLDFIQRSDVRDREVRIKITEMVISALKKGP